MKYRKYEVLLKGNEVRTIYGFSYYDAVSSSDIDSSRIMSWKEVRDNQLTPYLGDK